MKRWILYILLLGFTVAAPAKPLNIGELLPIQTMGVYREGNQYRIATDTGNIGYGQTVSQAIRNMEDTALGIIYMDKLEYLILTEETTRTAEELKTVLKPNVRVYMGLLPLDITEAAEYLSTHGELPRLKACIKKSETPAISSSEKYKLFQKKSKKGIDKRDVRW